MEIIKKTLNYIFETTPGREFSYYYFFLILTILLLTGAILLKQYHQNKTKRGDYVFKKMFRKTSSQIIYFAIGFLFFIGVRYENIPYFAMRLWLILLILGLIAFAIRQLYKYFKIYPVELENFESRPRKKSENTYLPNKR